MMCSRFLWAPCTCWAKYAWSTFWALFNDFCNKSSGCSAVYAADVWSDDLLGIQQHVRPVPYLSPTCSKLFLIFVWFLDKCICWERNSICGLCHKHMSMTDSTFNSKTSNFAFSSTWTLHQFQFDFKTCPLSMLKIKFTVLKKKSTHITNLNSIECNRTWIFLQIKTMRPLSWTPTWVMIWQLFLNNPSFDKWQRGRVKKSKLSPKQKYKPKNLTNPFHTAAKIWPNQKSKRAAGECGKYLSLLSEMYFHVASTAYLRQKTTNNLRDSAELWERILSVWSSICWSTKYIFAIL